MVPPEDLIAVLLARALATIESNSTDASASNLAFDCASVKRSARLAVASLLRSPRGLQWHPHLHLITTDGGRAADGSWHAPAQWDAERLMRLFRERLLGSLLDKRAISRELVQKLLAWRHPGFSAHVGEPIAAEDKQRLEHTAAYLVRNPLSLKKLVYLDGRQAVLYRSRLNPALGRNFEAMDPLEWLARMSDHIPDPGQHLTLFYGEYSNRVRGTAHCSEPDTTPPSRPNRSPGGAAPQAGPG